MEVWRSGWHTWIQQLKSFILRPCYSSITHVFSEKGHNNLSWHYKSATLWIENFARSQYTVSTVFGIRLKFTIWPNIYFFIFIMLKDASWCKSFYYIAYSHISRSTLTKWKSLPPALGWWRAFKTLWLVQFQ